MRGAIAIAGLVILLMGLTADLTGLGSYSGFGAVQAGSVLVGAILMAGGLLVGRRVKDVREGRAGEEKPVAGGEPEGLTPLHAAVRSSDVASVTSQLQLGADVNARNRRGETPLHFAVARDYEEIVRLLVDAGADLDIQHHGGKTPVDTAQALGRTNIMRMLEPREGD